MYEEDKKYIAVDEFQGWLSVEELQGICNGGTFNFKGSKTVIPADCVVIILSNRTPEQVYGFETNLDAFYERFEVEEMR
jgi:hypothetical protein